MTLGLVGFQQQAVRRTDRQALCVEAESEAQVEAFADECFGQFRCAAETMDDAGCFGADGFA